MFRSYISILFHSFFIFTITCSLVSSDVIPVMLWNINGNALHVKPASALGHNDKVLSESLKDVLHQESHLLVFTLNKLSLEDLGNVPTHNAPGILNNTLYNIESFLDLQPFMLLPSVKDPLDYIHKAHCGVQEIVVDNKIDDAVIQAVASAYQTSCVVILHISDDGIIPNESEQKSIFLPTIDNSNKNLVGVFTGVKSSWGSPNNERRMRRNLLQATASNDNFLNYTGCIIMYADSASLQLGREQNGTVNLPFPPTFEGSCDNTTTRTLQLNFKTTGPVSEVTIKFEFPQSRGSWTVRATLSMTGEKVPKDEIELKTGFIDAPMKFSYSCGDLKLETVNDSLATVRFNRFQIQPYQVKDVFSDSFDCVTFFTIPIWMGIVVSILFIAITNIGVYALFSVRTMDRFDDPKGKTISVAATAD